VSGDGDRLNGEKTARATRGRFAPGNPGGPGRPPLARERENLVMLQDGAT
jgi:hypothetical protein